MKNDENKDRRQGQAIYNTKLPSLGEKEYEKGTKWQRFHTKMSLL